MYPLNMSSGKLKSSWQAIDMRGAQDWEYFAVDGVHYLTVAHHDNGATHNVQFVVYRLNNLCWN